MEQRRFAIIDNDVDDMEILEAIIKEVDQTAVCIGLVFSDQALRLLQEEVDAPDCVFIDVNMERVTGRECLRQLSANPKFSNTRLVMYSGVMPIAVGESFIKLGAFSYFQKPLEASEYRKIVDRIFAELSAKIDVLNPLKSEN